MSLELRRQPPGFSQILTRRSSAGGEKQGTMEAANPGDSGHRQRGGRWGTRKGERAAPFGARGALGEGRMRAVGGGQ